MGAGGGMVNLVSVGRLYIDRASHKIGQFQTNDYR